MSFNSKAKSTSQFFYDLRRETQEEINKKFRSVIEEYFAWYSEFQNKDPITEVKLYSADFVCSNRCSNAGTAQHSVVDLIIPKKHALLTLIECAEKFQIELKLTSL